MYGFAFLDYGHRKVYVAISGSVLKKGMKAGGEVMSIRQMKTQEKVKKV